MASDNNQKGQAVRRYHMLLLAALVLASGLVLSCPVESGLPQAEKELHYSIGHKAGYSQGYWLTDDYRAFWTPPDGVDDLQNLYPQVDVRDVYIPKGYETADAFANARFQDGTRYNDKQKSQAAEAYNWGFYDGFCRGADDYVDGKPHLYGP